MSNKEQLEKIMSELDSAEKLAKKKRRELYASCNHKGKCTKENCSCLQTRGNCEKFCFCSSIKCEYAYKGCDYFLCQY